MRIRAAQPVVAADSLRSPLNGEATVLPGLIDTRTHILLQGEITAADYDEQLLKQSTPYRASWRRATPG